MSIENQATFYFRNVCDYNPSIKSDIALTDFMVRGFTEFSALLRTIYQDWKSYEISTIPSEQTKIGIMADDLENYHNLTDTLDCLYAIATVGELCSEGEFPYLFAGKSLFKSAYKKSVTFSFGMLRKYGFCFKYYKGDKETEDYKRCDSFRIYYENSKYLIEAIKFAADRLMHLEKKKEMPEKVAFMLSDYYFILTGQINQNPLQESILKTLGSLNGLWKQIVRAVQDDCGLVADSSFNPYVFPNRVVTYKRGKKTICKFGITADRLNVRLPLLFEAAKVLIIKRKSLPQSINQNIDRFGCVGCGKCEAQSNIVMVEGVPVCNLPYSNFVTEDSRCLCFDISHKEEVDVICDVIKNYAVEL